MSWAGAAYFRIVLATIGLVLAQFVGWVEASIGANPGWISSTPSKPRPSPYIFGEPDRAALNDMGRKALESDKFAEAEKHFAAAVEAAKSADVEDTTLVASLVGLAAVKSKQKKPDADATLWRALRVIENIPDANPLDVAAVLVKLAESQKEKAAWAQAESLYRRALAQQELKLGPDHPDLLPTIVSLTRLQPDEESLRRCLALQEKHLGKDHLDVARTLGALANTYVARGRMGDAEPLLKRQLGILDQRLGREHIEAAQVRGSFARLLGNIGNYAEAEAQYKSDIAAHQKNPDVNSAHSYVGLALLYMDQGRQDDAERTLKAALEAVAKDDEAARAYTTEIQFRLARSYRHQAKYVEAAELLGRMLASHEQALGPGDPSWSVDLATELGHVNRAQGNTTQAEQYFVRAIDPLNVDGAEHRADDARRGLAALYVAQQEFLYAEVLLRDILSDRDAALTNDNAQWRVAETRRLLAGVLAMQGEAAAEAEQLYEQSLATLRVRPRHNTLQDARRLFAQANRLWQQNRFAEAEDSFWSALKEYERSLGPDHADVARVYESLAKLLRTRDRGKEAGVYERRAAVILTKKQP